MKKTTHSLLLLFFGILCSCNRQVSPPLPYGALPTEAQKEWQHLNYYMFIHFGPNTFTDVEWGDGKEDPSVFNPSHLDCRQWAATAKAAGMKGIIITAKHHDGFCLWPSKYSTHTVRESAWKDGKGDLLRELSDACKDYGLKFGVYLSPWDQNHPAYGTDDYNNVFAQTLEEVLTSYGDVFEVWFDGANGEGHGGKKQVYDWELFHQTVFNNQPHAVIFSDIGPGCRWVGNEEGHVGETNWSRLHISGFEPGSNSPHLDTLNIGNKYGEAWVPAETNVSIRPGWFYSSFTDDQVKTVEQLVQIFYTSVGRNSNLLLNVPPDRTGRIHRNDSIRLMEFRQAIEESFAENIASEAIVTADKTRGDSEKYKASHVLDEDYHSYWTTDDNDLEASLTLTFTDTKQFNRLLIQEYTPLGQRVAAFKAEYYDLEADCWEHLIAGTTIGYRRILRFPVVSTNRIKISLTETLASPVLNRIALYHAPEMLSTPVIERNKVGMVSIQCETSDPAIHFTTDGSEPLLSSPVYKEPFALPQGGVVKAIAVVENGALKSETIKVSYDLAPIRWSIVSPLSSEANKTIDGSAKTAGTLNLQEALVIDLGEKLMLKGFVYAPVHANWAPHIYRYNVYAGNDPNRLKPMKVNAVFNNIKNNPIPQHVLFNETVEARYIKVEPVELTQSGHEYTVAEISVITQ